MNHVFADTFYYLALLNAADEAHDDAIAFTSDYDGTIVTTDWVLTELADGLSRLRSRVIAAQFISSQLSDPAVRVVPAGRKLLDRGLQLYTRRTDKEWSLTDCISFVVMKKLKIRDALTGDHHFQQSGFRPIFLNK